MKAPRSLRWSLRVGCRLREGTEAAYLLRKAGERLFVDHIRPAPANTPSESAKGLGSCAVSSCLQHLLSVPRTPEPASSRLLCSPLFRFVLSGLLPHPHDPPQQNKLLFTRNLGNQQGRRCELELAVASPLMVNWEAGQYVQKGVWMVSRNRGKQSNLTKGCTPHSTVHACMHAFIRSFIATHSFLRLPTQPLSQPTQPTSRWSGFSGAFSSFTPNLHVSLSSSFFPSLWQFFFLFQKETYENC